MDILTKLSELGFTNATLLDEKQGLCRIMTSNGWTYQRFDDEASVDVWARDHKPEGQ
jgi:hypothetical protein